MKHITATPLVCCVTLSLPVFPVHPSNYLIKKTHKSSKSNNIQPAKSAEWTKNDSRDYSVLYCSIMALQTYLCWWPKTTDRFICLNVECGEVQMLLATRISSPDRTRPDEGKDSRWNLAPMSQTSLCVRLCRVFQRVGFMALSFDRMQLHNAL